MSGLYSDLAEYYDAMYSSKGYRAESARVVELARRYGRSGGGEQLDVACGTGRHLEYLAKGFHCTGADASPTMLRIARRRLPSARFVRGDMRSFRLRQRYDVVSCLFSAIGYVRTLAGLRRTVANFRRHLKPGGVLIIEPWLTPGAVQPGHVHRMVHDRPELKIARASSADRRGRLSILRMHYLIAKPGRPVRYVEDVHTSGLFTVEETLRILREAGFEVRFLRRGLMSGRGVFVGRLPLTPEKKSPASRRQPTD
jgi:SAM-dependent methyltransferase